MIPNRKRTLRVLKPESPEERAPAFVGVNRWLLGHAKGNGDRIQAAAIANAASGGCPPSNTHPPTLHATHTSGGIDWLSVSIYAEPTPTYAQILKVALDAKAQAIRNRTKGHSIYIGDGIWGTVGKNGQGRGFGHTPVVISIQGLTVRLATGETPGPLLFVDMPGAALLAHGEYKCVALLQQVLRNIGVEPTRMTCRRLDICADLVGALRSRFRKAFEGRRYITRSRDMRAFYQSGVFTGFEAGGGTCSMTVYDKVLEIVTKHPEKLPAMKQFRWGGVMPHQAWRVEFRIRPDENTRMEWRNLDEMLEGIATIAQWACRSWFRMVQRNIEGHSERTKIDTVWHDVALAFERWTGDFRRAFVRRKTVRPTSERMARQALGTLKTACLISGLCPADKSADELFVRLLYSMTHDDDPMPRELWEDTLVDLMAELAESYDILRPGYA